MRTFRRMSGVLLMALLVSAGGSGAIAEELELPIVCNEDGRFVASLQAVQWIKRYEVFGMNDVVSSVANGNLQCGFIYTWQGADYSTLQRKKVNDAWYSMIGGGAWPTEELLLNVVADPEAHPEAASDFATMTGQSPEFWACVIGDGRGDEEYCRLIDPK
ncbi:hypothetical protein [Hoeflea alexandrii]